MLTNTVSTIQHCTDTAQSRGAQTASVSKEILLSSIMAHAWVIGRPPREVLSVITAATPEDESWEKMVGELEHALTLCGIEWEEED